MSRYKNMKAGLKKEDFILKDGWFDSRIRPPGSMHQQQFQMSDCESTDLFIFDASACVYVDRCKHCYIFIGPCQASVFIRNCFQCTVICISKQFRVRDSHECIFSLFCQSQPVIQSSSSLVFSCFPNWGYQHLQQQMKSLNLSKWNNNWWDVYDFTKNSQKQNYRIKKLKEDSDLDLKKFTYNLQKIGLEKQNGIIPKTYGIKEGKQNLQKSSILIFNKFPPPIANQWNNIKVIQTRSYKPNKQLLDVLDFQLQMQFIFVKIELRGKGSEQENIIKNLKYLKRIDNVSSELNSMIFVPFKDQH